MSLKFILEKIVFKKTETFFKLYYLLSPVND